MSRANTRGAGRGARRALDRDILRLAVPALGALVAEPLFLLADTAMVGHLGADALAGLGAASAILQTTVGLLVFLAYATTPTVARRLGAGDRRGAIRAGIDGMWLALTIGVPLSVIGVWATGPIVAAFGTSAEATAGAEIYLLISLIGLPGMLLVIAANGLLRGLQDTRTPLVVSVVGFGANIALNALFIYGLGLGLAGAAIGTVIAQWGMASVFIVMAVRAARTTGASLRPGLTGVTGAAMAGGWLLLRTVSLRASMLATVFVASGFGVVELATLQIVATLFSTLAFMLDALAIAGQALIGHGLGAADLPRVRAVTRRLILHGLVFGVVLGALIAALTPVLGRAFTGDTDVQAALAPTLLVLSLGIPLAGYVFVLDGVLIGAGDARYLALTGILNAAMFAPLVVWVAVAEPADAMPWLWAAYGFGYMGARALTLGLRAGGLRWARTGAA